MSRKKAKTVNKNLLANAHIEEEIQDNQLTPLRKLKIKLNKKFTEKQKLLNKIALDDETKLIFIDDLQELQRHG